eukprot:g16006.t1
MWVEAFELCLSRIPKELRERVDRISGAAQQHGTVYLTEQAVAVALARSSGSSSSYFWPVEELLYRSDAPIWMDMSTTAQVNRLEESFGWRELTHRTGSRAYERFSGVQIAKVLEEEEGKAKKPGEKLARVQLVSNFMCSLCAGCLCPIELSDAAGMNLLNLHTNAWDTDILRFLNIEQTLLGGPPDVFVSSSASSSTTTSCPDKNISPYLVEQYGFRENAVVLPWTGDNCSAVVGSGLFSDGEAVVSLGTSDTLLFLLPEGEGGVLSGGDEDNVLAQQLPYGHTFPHAAMDGRKFMMLCYSNGDVCRKAVRDSCVREECAAEFAEFASAGSSSTSTRTPAAIRPPGVRVEVDGDPTTAAGADHVEASAATPQTSAELSPPNEVEDQLSGNAETRLPIRKHSTGSKPQLSLTELSVNSRSPSIGHGDEWTEETPAMQAAKLWRRFDSLVAEARKSVGEFVAAFTAVDEICPPVKQVSVEVVPATAKTSSTGTAPTDVKKTAAVPPFRRSVPALFAKRTSSFSYELEPGPVGSDPNITPAVFCRAVLEHRALAMKAHARKLKGPSSNRDGLFSRITVAGGGARNEGFLQILADVFQCEVVVRENAANLCAMGAPKNPQVEALKLLKGTDKLKQGLAEMLKGGVIMDVMNVEQAKIAEKAGACAVMALERIPADIMKGPAGKWPTGATFPDKDKIPVHSDPKMIKDIMAAVSIPVMAKVRIGHFVEAQVLEAVGVDYVDESEVLTIADADHHIDKTKIAEGASMIRTKGEAGTGDVVEAVRHIRTLHREIRQLQGLADDELYHFAKQIGADVTLVKKTRDLGRLPVVNFAAGGVATPADAALCMQLGVDGVFVGSGIFKSTDPAPRARAIVELRRG